MFDDSLALTIPAEDSPIPNSEYDAILATIAETERGRLFLDEHARRHRGADTGLVLAAIERVGEAVRSVPPPHSRKEAQREIDRMTASIIEARGAIAAGGDAAAVLTALVDDLERSLCDLADRMPSLEPVPAAAVSEADQRSEEQPEPQADVLAESIVADWSYAEPVAPAAKATTPLPALELTRQLVVLLPPDAEPATASEDQPAEEAADRRVDRAVDWSADLVTAPAQADSPPAEATSQSEEPLSDQAAVPARELSLEDIEEREFSPSHKTELAAWNAELTEPARPEEAARLFAEALPEPTADRHSTASPKTDKPGSDPLFDTDLFERGDEAPAPDCAEAQPAAGKHSPAPARAKPPTDQGNAEEGEPLLVRLETMRNAIASLLDEMAAKKPAQ